MDSAGPRVDETPQNMQGDAWQEVLHAVDKTYAELVDYQEQLESRNQELTAMRQFLSSVMASISDYLVVIDRSGAISDAGEAVCQALGLELSQVLDRTIDQVFSPVDDTTLDVHLGYMINTRKDVTLDAVLIGVDEPVELRISPRMDRRRKVVGAVLTARPLGELRRAFAELAESHDELKQAQVQLVRNEKLASLGRLLAGVAHELNNPISFVYANTHAMDKYVDRFETYFRKVESGAPRDELITLRAELKLDREMRNLRTALEGARDGAARVRDLVEDLRRLSADGSGEFERFDLVDLARNAVSWIERGTKRSLNISYTGVSEAFVMGRSSHLQQVLLNLVQNAADATETIKTPEIVLDVQHVEGDVHLAVLDNGPGVPTDLVDHIFDPFFTTKEVGRGTGLGLSISHKIVEEHGGTLKYRDRDGAVHGACFHLTLRSKPIE